MKLKRKCQWIYVIGLRLTHLFYMSRLSIQHCIRKDTDQSQCDMLFYYLHNNHMCHCNSLHSNHDRTL